MRVIQGCEHEDPTLDPTLWGSRQLTPTGTWFTFELRQVPHGYELFMEGWEENEPEP